MLKKKEGKKRPCDGVTTEMKNTFFNLLKLACSPFFSTFHFAKVYIFSVILTYNVIVLKQYRCQEIFPSKPMS